MKDTFVTDLKAVSRGNASFLKIGHHHNNVCPGLVNEIVMCEQPHHLREGEVHRLLVASNID